MLGLATGVGPGSWTARPAGVWWQDGAVLDADFVAGRFYSNGRSFADETAFLAAIGGTRTGVRRAIGPYVLPGAPELLANTGFDDLTGWSAVLNGTSTVASVAGAAQFTSDGSVGIGQGGAGLTADAVTAADTPYALEVQTLAGTSGMRFGSTLYGNEGGSSGQLSPNTLWRLPVSGRGATGRLYLYRGAAGSSNIDRVSLKEATIFDGFAQGGFTAELAAKAPPTHAAAKTLATFHSGGLVDRVAAYRNAAGALIVQVRYANADVANLTLGTLADGAEFRVRLGARSNEFYARLDNGPILSDLGGAMPPLARLSLGQEADGTQVWDGDIYRCTVSNGGGFGQFVAGVDDLLHFDGDSFAGGAYGVVLPTTLAAATGRPVHNTGVGGSSMAQISARIVTAPPELRAKTTVIWDGDDNGATTAAAYCDELAAALQGLGHHRFVLIPPCVHYGQTDVSLEAVIRDEMLDRWPGNLVDWRDVLALSGNTPAAAMYFDSGTDATHLSQAAMDLMAAAIGSFIADKVW